MRRARRALADAVAGASLLLYVAAAVIAVVARAIDPEDSPWRELDPKTGGAPTIAP